MRCALVTANGPEGARLAAVGTFLERCLAGMTAALQGYTLGRWRWNPRRSQICGVDRDSSHNSHCFGCSVSTAIPASTEVLSALLVKSFLQYWFMSLCFMWPSSPCRCQFGLCLCNTSRLPLCLYPWADPCDTIYPGSISEITPAAKGFCLMFAIYLAVSIYALGGMPTARPA